MPISETEYLANGEETETTYSNYTDGKPETIVVESGPANSLTIQSTTVDTYDGAGNLIGSVVTYPGGATLTTGNSYTSSNDAATYDVPVGLLYSSTTPGANSTSADPTTVITSNQYYGNGSNGSYIVNAPYSWEIGQLASSTDSSGVTTYHVYDNQGNQVLSLHMASGNCAGANSPATAGRLIARCFHAVVDDHINYVGKNCTRACTAGTLFFVSSHSQPESRNSIASSGD